MQGIVTFTIRGAQVQMCVRAIQTLIMLSLLQLDKVEYVGSACSYFRAWSMALARMWMNSSLQKIL